MANEIFQTITLALFMGVLATLVGRWLRVPAILFYLVAGLSLGTVGLGWLQVGYLGQGIVVLVELMVAVILFEGGLSLSTHSFRKSGVAIPRMLLISIPLTGLGAAILGYMVLHLPWPEALFFGALIVVTGPTVMGSILKSVPLTASLQSLLNWESIWGDVLGVLLSAIALEWIIPTSSYTPGHAGFVFGIRILVGLIVGCLGGYSLGRWVFPLVAKLNEPALPGVIAFASALLIFFLANAMVEHSGPLAAAVAGFTLSTTKTKAIREIRHFKEQVSIVLISTLFILLSAHIDPFAVTNMWPQMLVVALVLGAFVRPIAVLSGLMGSPMPWRERIYAGLIGPRGIVALATVSYANLLIGKENSSMAIITNLTFAIIFLSGTFATLVCRPLATLLDVAIPETGLGILFVGINPISSELARFASRYIPVAFLDTSSSMCGLAQRLGHETVCANVLDSDVYEEAMEQGFGRLLAISTDDSLNQLVAQTASVHLGPGRVYWVQAASKDQSLVIESSQPTLKAFAPDFSLRGALRRLSSGEAFFDVVTMNERFTPIPDGVTPLLQVTEKGKGIRIVHAGDPPNGEVLCLNFNQSQ